MKFVYFTSFAILLWSGLILGQPQFESLESRLLFLDTQFDSLTVLEKNAAEKINSLAEEISKLKSQGHLGYFERRRLESLLKESQELLRKQQELQAEISNYNDQRITLVDQLINRYSIAIDSLLTIADKNSPPLSLEEKAAVAHQMQILRSRKDILIRKLAQKPDQKSTTVLVEILPGDTPREIEEKADYLNDQEDKLRWQVEKISAKVKELATEADLRLRMSEFLDDVRLFDQREEPMTPSEVANALTKTESMGRTYWTNTGLDATEEGAKVLPSALDQMFMIDMSDIAPEDLEELISRFESESQRLLQQADSLSTLAKMFRRQAKSLRNN